MGRPTAVQPGFGKYAPAVNLVTEGAARRLLVCSCVKEIYKPSSHAGEMLRAMRTFLEDVQRATRRDRLCRALDLIGAACAILFVLPLLAFVTALVACGSGPVMVRHRHVRGDGVCCNLLKFRTLRDTPAMPDDRADLDPQPS